LDYTSSREALGEHFHMSEDLLAEINPGNKFDRVGDKINVAGLSADKQSSKVSRIEVDKGRETVRTLAQDGTLVAFYPASIGSEEKPTPSGTLKVVSIEPNPTYRYDPKYKFKGVESTKPFTINAGPNNPIGTMWIGLSENGYGIPKSESHGCVRMTNWDVERLAKSVRKGVEVSFVEAK
jgi:lipoprotein-anchoring transpeptidase ErfK/SrfK